MVFPAAYAKAQMDYFKNDLLASKLLNEEDQIKLNMIKDNDNPVIVKIYFNRQQSF
jgi:hypothetical protein